MSLTDGPDRGPIQPEVIDPSGGANQTRVRAYNERLVMSLVRRHGELSKADIARRSGLSAQTVSVIMRALESDGLLGARRAGARPCRPAVDADAAQPGCGVFLWGEDRASKCRPGADGFRRQYPPAPAPDPCLSAARRTGRLHRRRHREARDATEPRGAQAHRRDRHRHALRTVELGGRSRRPAGRNEPVARGGPAGDRGRNAPAIRCSCRTTAPAPAAPNSPSASAPAIPTSSISTSARSSAAASSSIPRSFPAAPAPPAPSARCRFPARTARPSSS